MHTYIYTLPYKTHTHIYTHMYSLPYVKLIVYIRTILYIINTVYPINLFLFCFSFLHLSVMLLINTIQIICIIPTKI